MKSLNEQYLEALNNGTVEAFSQTLPPDASIEWCESGGCPGFVVNWTEDWPKKLLRTVHTSDYEIRLCAVCEDAQDDRELRVAPGPSPRGKPFPQIIQCDCGNFLELWASTRIYRCNGDTVIPANAAETTTKRARPWHPVANGEW